MQASSAARETSHRETKRSLCARACFSLRIPSEKREKIAGLPRIMKGLMYNGQDNVCVSLVLGFVLSTALKFLTIGHLSMPAIYGNDTKTAHGRVDII